MRPPPPAPPEVSRTTLSVEGLIQVSGIASSPGSRLSSSLRAPESRKQRQTGVARGSQVDSSTSGRQDTPLHMPSACRADAVHSMAITSQGAPPAKCCAASGAGEPGWQAHRIAEQVRACALPQDVHHRSAGRRVPACACASSPLNPKPRRLLPLQGAHALCTASVCCARSQVC